MVDVPEFSTTALPPQALPPQAPLPSQPVGTGSAHRRTPVQWLSLRQLLTTAVEVVQAMMFARFADKREAMASCPREYHRLFPPQQAPETVWVDYVADTGDGFDATFATARCLAGTAPDAQHRLALNDLPQFAGRPQQAHLLVLGGDEVYPVASMDQYEDRLASVLRQAAALGGMSAADRPPVLALPGNHDWYDGLTAFRRYFCESWVLEGRSATQQPGPEPIDLPPVDKRDDVGGWSAFQSRSYFAVQLSPDWWLWAVDSQLDAAIDAEQLAYFTDAQTRLGDADVILCTATPCWLEAGDAGDGPYRAVPEKPLFTLLWFIDRILGDERDRVRLLLTGDKHHYATYLPIADAAAPPLVTCGGGGAFTSATHQLPDVLDLAQRPWAGSDPHTEYALANCFPDRAASKAETSGLKFLKPLWLNGPGFPLLAGAVNALLFVALVLHSPLWITLGAVAVLGFLLPYATSGIKGRRRGWAKRAAVAWLVLGHTVLHLLPGVLLAFLLSWRLDGHDALPVAAAFVLSVLAGPVAFVTYLHIADRAGYHTLEAFSALHLEKYKCHLRMEITGKRVRLHVVGMTTVPRAYDVDDLTAVLPDARVIDTLDVLHRTAQP